MTKLNNSFIATRNNPFLLFVISLMAFLAITFLIMPLTANAEENTSTTDETDHMSIDNEPSVHNHQEQSDNDKINNETTSTEDESEDVTEQQETEDSTEEQDSVEVDEENNTSDIDESDSEDVNDSDENNSESADEELDIENSEDIDTESEEEVENTPESEEEDEDVEATEEKENDKEKSNKVKDEKPKVSATAAVSSSKSTSFKEGDRHKDIIQIKKDLHKVGFGGMNLNDLYGSYTAKRVKQFQQYFGLKANGIANQATQTKLSTTANSPLQEGKRHNDTIQLKHDLKKAGFGGMNINNLYGSYTAKRVKDFQKKYGLKVNGIADEVTLNKLKSLHPASFKQGDRHKDVIQIKKDLTKVGFGGMNLNDLYGSYTAERVKQFQQYFGLTANGIANQATQNKLTTTANSPLQEGKRHNDTIQLKNDLKKAGFGGMNINNLYGSYTAKRVKDFQKKHGLKVNGIADEVTLKKLKTITPVYFEVNDRHNKVIQIKKDLTKVGFGGMNLNNLYGSYTAERVKQFQQYFGLTANGIANQATQNKLTTTANSPLQEGKRHNDTIQLKNDLKKAGFGGMNINNLYGSYTAKRVKDFQKKHGLKVNGIADEVTLKKIATEVKKTTKKVVYLDAGHGGSDPGAKGNGLQEKDLTLDIAKRVQKLLEANGFIVMMSRTTDKYLTLDQRTKEANDAKADIFVSIHINSFTTESANGIETWKMSAGHKANESNILAKELQKELIKETKLNDRGVKDGNLHVNRESKMPSSLVELGFISNKNDAKKLKQTSFKNTLAKAISNGIKSYFKLV